MKPYITESGKGNAANFWGDDVKPKFKRVFKKAVRQQGKKEIRNELFVPKQLLYTQPEAPGK